MNSLNFIQDAKALIIRMDNVAALKTIGDQFQQEKQIQQDLEFLCINMTNPSLPSAARLIQAAMKHKYSVDQRTINKVNQFSWITPG